MVRDLTVPASDVARILERAHAPRVAIVAGSGLGGIAQRVEDAVRVPYAELEGVPQAPGVVGHAGELVLGVLGGVPVAVFGGRVHCYQGVSAYDASFPARYAAALGCEILVVTNAAGGVSLDLRTGTLMLISDQVNFTRDNPLVGWPGPEGGNPFVPMDRAYDPDLRALASDVARAEGIDLHPEGVYFGLLGPSYETPAEVRMLRALGADAVGMSTVHEVIAARALGLRVLGFSLITNVAAGHGLSHQEVLDAGKDAAERMERLTVGILQRLP